MAHCSPSNRCSHESHIIKMIVHACEKTITVYRMRILTQALAVCNLVSLQKRSEVFVLSGDPYHYWGRCHVCFKMTMETCLVH